MGIRDVISGAATHAALRASSENTFASTNLQALLSLPAGKREAGLKQWLSSLDVDQASHLRENLCGNHKMAQVFREKIPDAKVRDRLLDVLRPQQTASEWQPDDFEFSGMVAKNVAKEMERKMDAQMKKMALRPLTGAFGPNLQSYDPLRSYELHLGEGLFGVLPKSWQTSRPWRDGVPSDGSKKPYTIDRDGVHPENVTIESGEIRTGKETRPWKRIFTPADLSAVLHWGLPADAKLTPFEANILEIAERRGINFTILLDTERGTQGYRLSPLGEGYVVTDRDGLMLDSSDGPGLEPSAIQPADLISMGVSAFVGRRLLGHGLRRGAALLGEVDGVVGKERAMAFEALQTGKARLSSRDEGWLLDLKGPTGEPAETLFSKLSDKEMETAFEGLKRGEPRIRLSARVKGSLPDLLGPTGKNEIPGQQLSAMVITVD